MKKRNKALSIQAQRRNVGREEGIKRKRAGERGSEQQTQHTTETKKKKKKSCPENYKVG
jgi:hypothetical protein